MSTFTVVEGRDPLLSVELAYGEKVIAESNAMVMHDGLVSVEGRMSGGLMASLMRSFANDESFFIQQIEGISKTGQGQIMLAPQAPGDIKVLNVSGGDQYILNRGCFLACDAGVSIENRMNSLGSALFGDTGGFVIMQTSGSGQVAVSGFGQIFEAAIEPGQELVIDNGHLVAWSTGLRHEISAAASGKGMFGRMLSSAKSGEFMVLRFTGHGKVLVASRNLSAYLAGLSPR
ncbi:TIGR00266 family protein [Azomonas macrocytogenes]|uniref:Uncharacterized protein (TIGR00266 family) n=1 Tax=Azomonas macrocytogenes TaxID=69962 RepID=A0A839TB92_AZOMA|nr:TIGR00266 family protein [Azomonas macrocytogenes]MBB3104883.1 uncharacterized protein (TIGR00266 family) [Azomonas macrocytogenes]